MVDLQVEVDRIQELISNLYGAMHESSVTSTSRRTIKREIVSTKCDCVFSFIDPVAKL